MLENAASDPPTNVIMLGSRAKGGHLTRPEVDRARVSMSDWSQDLKSARAVVCSSQLEMALQTTSPFRVGQVLEIGFPTFTPPITIHSERELTVEIVAGDNVGFSDTV
jgi:hypothetical protein